MNIKQLKSKVEGLEKSKVSLEEKRDAALKVLDDKRAQVKADWDEKISEIQGQIEQYSKALKEQEKLEAMLKQAQASADALGKKTEGQ
ncbi:MAG: hypothetical protein IKF80_07705 [Erysipelotrichaceae bacterium]|nr:hypothetical protein [Erysipelotrichaceae bacterium]